MAAFLYRCPNTGLQVQGYTADDLTEGDVEAYESLKCLACTRMHLVNPKTGKVLGADEAPPASSKPLGS
jgi:BRK domain